MSKSNINWHSSFISDLKITLQDYENQLTYNPEYTLNTGSRRIDCLIEKEANSPSIPSPIAEKFRRYNLIDYKSPNESMNIENFYKVLSYAYSLPDHFHDISVLDNLTISLVSHRFPRNLAKHFKEKYNKTLEKIIPGLYYIVINNLPIQLITLQKLPIEEYFWLHALAKNLPNKISYQDLCRAYKPHMNDPNYQNVMNAITYSLQSIKGGNNTMCQAIKELFYEVYGNEFKKQEEARNQLGSLLLKENRLDDLARSFTDPIFQNQLLQEYNLLETAN